MKGARGYCAILLGLLVGCGEEGERSTYTNVGEVCVQLVDGGRLRATVRFPTCLSSSCDRALATSCALSAADDTLRVESEGASESTGASECTDDCGSLTAECEMETKMSPGSYVLVHGASRQTVELGTDRVCAFGR